eukprot:11737429-Ditylum_brightwellii.AAC.1
MVLNPTLLVHGLRYLMSLWTHKDEKYDRFVARAKQIFKDATMEMIKPTKEEDATADDAGNDNDNEDDILADLFANPMDLMNQACRAPSRQTSTSCAQKKAEEITKSWFALTINSERMIKEQYVRKNKAANVESVDWKS